MIGAMSLGFSSMVGFDFHPDLDRMETLKTLPIRPVPLVLGQLFVPTMILTVAQWIAIGVTASIFRVEPTLLVTGCLILVPVNALLIEIENLFFLWYPIRLGAGNSADFQTMGRVMLLMMAKFTCVGIGATAAVAIGAGCFFLFGESWTAAVASGWIVIALFALSLVPLVAQAFTHFDVSRDLPE